MPILQDPFHGEFSSLRPGTRIGFVHGPCENPEDRAGIVYGKGEDRWGRWVRVKFPDCSFATIHGLTVRGIGAYLLPRR
jgi:hypothetical protein